MEVTATNFSTYLPWLLNEISNCCFISFDLEFSGIPLPPSGRASKVQSLQERYAENKAAAEKYQILQIGLTICLEDTEKGKW